MGRSLTGIGIVLSVAACGAEPDRAAFVTRDSAGVSLVESSAPSWNDRSSWRLADQPHATVGTAEGAEEYQLSWIWDALRLQSGAIVVGNAGSQQLRFYDSAGRFTRSTGRKGEGPGEFGAFADMRIWRLPGGLLAVRDAPLPRINLFDTTGTFLRTVTFANPEGAARPHMNGAFADGTLFVAAYEPDGGTRSGEVVRSGLRYYRYGPDGAQIALIGSTPTAPRYVHQAGNTIHYPYLPLTVEPAIVADSATVLLLRNGEPEIERFDLGGKLLARIRWHSKRRSVTGELYKQYVSADLDKTQNPQQKGLYEMFYKLSLPLPDVVPAYKDIRVDDTRHIWVEQYRLPWEAERVWDVLDPRGRWLGAVTLPGRFWFHRAGQNYLLGTQMDSLDVEQIQVYALSRTPR